MMYVRDRRVDSIWETWWLFFVMKSPYAPSQFVDIVALFTPVLVFVVVVDRFDPDMDWMMGFGLLNLGTSAAVDIEDRKVSFFRVLVSRSEVRHGPRPEPGLDVVVIGSQSI